MHFRSMTAGDRRATPGQGWRGIGTKPLEAERRRRIALGFSLLEGMIVP